MRKIMFRGRVPDSDKVDGGKIVYGYLIVYRDGRHTHWITPDDDVSLYNYPVEPESVEQLIGEDRDGNVIYEGDPVKRIHGRHTKAHVMEATFEDYSGIMAGEIVKAVR